jgi:hypothetical protein
MEQTWESILHLRESEHPQSLLEILSSKETSNYKTEEEMNEEFAAQHMEQIKHILPVVQIPTGWTQAQIDSFTHLINESPALVTRGGLTANQIFYDEMMNSPISDSDYAHFQEQFQNPIANRPNFVVPDEWQKWHPREEIQCIRGLKQNKCPALPKLEELGSYRNHRFVFVSKTVFTSHDIEHLLRSMATYSIKLTKSYDFIDTIWGMLMKFGQFDFPLLLSNNEIIYL